MKTNKEVYEYLLRDQGNMNPEKVISQLIEGGFIKADQTDAEKYAEKARRWVSKVKNYSPSWTLDMATGWNTAGWVVVLGLDSDDDVTRMVQQNIYQALRILEDEANG